MVPVLRDFRRTAFAAKHFSGNIIAQHALSKRQLPFCANPRFEDKSGVITQRNSACG